ncbi:hypothetical protein CHS0354_007496 [Potamilus streckersoni]|uniref:Uncharacterized protein n=1 Tax=Potamilus streckersoni TaxID=2493646 RepID=A0AAE0W9H7_9BIVA|nr:hypothetical protein CHS0354_007496 [Potamilus streckersoni]
MSMTDLLNKDAKKLLAKDKDEYDCVTNDEVTNDSVTSDNETNSEVSQKIISDQHKISRDVIMMKSLRTWRS